MASDTTRKRLVTTGPILKLSGIVAESLGSLSNWPAAWLLLASIPTPDAVPSVVQRYIVEQDQLV